MIFELILTLSLMNTHLFHKTAKHAVHCSSIKKIKCSHTTRHYRIHNQLCFLRSRYHTCQGKGYPPSETNRNFTRFHQQTVFSNYIVLQIQIVKAAVSWDIIICCLKKFINMSSQKKLSGCPPIPIFQKCLRDAS